MIQLSKRLQAVADLVGECETIADVGTDHGYIPVFLVAGGKARRAIAMDINSGPLSRAEEHILQYGLEKNIELRLSDGCLALKPGEADAIVIAGMGGALMQRILRQGEETARAAAKLVLQPQSELAAFREFLFRQGYQITAEELVLEDGKYYPMIAARAAEAQESAAGKAEEEKERAGGKNAVEEKGMETFRADSGEDGIDFRLACRFGPLLLSQRHPVLKQYLHRQQKQKRAILQNLKEHARQDAAARVEELEQDLVEIETALQYYETGTKGEII